MPGAPLLLLALLTGVVRAGGEPPMPTDEGLERAKLARVDAVLVEGKLEALRPMVEATAGRDLGELPPVLLSSTDSFTKMARAHLVARMVAHGYDRREASGRARIRVDDLLERSPAVYWPDDGAIHVLTDWAQHEAARRDRTARKLLELMGLDLAYLGDAVTCGLAMQLVVALQHQQAPPPVVATKLPGLEIRLVRVGPQQLDLETGWELVSRGQALSIGAVACHELNETEAGYVLMRGLSTRMDPDDLTGMLSGHGLGLVHHLRRQGGEQAVWHALEHPRPWKSTLRDAFEVEVGRTSWPTGQAMTGVFSQLMGPGIETLPGPLGPRHLRWSSPVAVQMGVQMRAQAPLGGELVVVAAELAPGTTGVEHLRASEKAWKRRRSASSREDHGYWAGSRLWHNVYNEPFVRLSTREYLGGVEVLSTRVSFNRWNLDHWEHSIAMGQRLVVVDYPASLDLRKDDVIAAVSTHLFPH